MKLTKSLRLAIIKQFKDGESLAYLTVLYGISLDRIEQVIRTEMILTEATAAPVGEINRIADT